MSEKAIMFDDVKQAFSTGFLMKQVEILHGISFAVEKNSIFGLLGPNGAGKTTLIHILTGIHKAKSGNIKILGVDSFDRKARNLIGYLPERPYFPTFLTGRQFLNYLGRLSEMKKAELQKRIPYCLEEVGLTHAADLEMRKYSKGMLQRVGIAQSILHDPEVLVLDEPMSGLDPVGRKRVREIILGLARKGKTVFFSSHIIPDVEAICGKIALLKQGKIVDSGGIDRFFDGKVYRAEILFKGELGWIRDNQSVVGTESSDGVLLEVSNKEDYNSCISTIIKNGGEIISAQPQRRSLEELF